MLDIEIPGKFGILCRVGVECGNLGVLVERLPGKIRAQYLHIEIFALVVPGINEQYSLPVQCKSGGQRTSTCARSHHLSLVRLERTSIRATR